MKIKEKNSFDTTVEMFKGADCIVLSHYDKKLGVVTGTPYNTRTGQHWTGMCMVSSIEEALNCKYKKACDPKDKALIKLLKKNEISTKPVKH